MGRTTDGTHRKAQSGGLVIRENNSLDSAGDYIMAGHDGTTNGDSYDYLTSVASVARWSREWVIEVTGTLSGSMVIGFDFSDAELSFNPENAANYQLLRWANSTSDFAEVPVTSKTISGNQILFTVPVGNLKATNVNTILSSGDQFTLGSSETESSPLPVSLTAFGVNSINNQDTHPVVEWRTETEYENYGFTVYRSFIPVSDNKSNNKTISKRDTVWTEMAFIEGHGNSTETVIYNWGDEEINEAGRYVYKLEQIDYDGKKTMYGPVEYSYQGPDSFVLNQNYPNPFNPVTTITYDISKKGKIHIEVYNILGRRVMTLVNKEMNPGSYTIAVDATNLASGSYFVRMSADGRIFHKKMMLIK